MFLPTWLIIILCIFFFDAIISFIGAAILLVAIVVATPFALIIGPACCGLEWLNKIYEEFTESRIAREMKTRGEDI